MWYFPLCKQKPYDNRKNNLHGSVLEGSPRRKAKVGQNGTLQSQYEGLTSKPAN